MTFTFFKDSEMLRGVVENQLRMRQFDLKDLRERAERAAALSGTEKFGSGTGKSPSDSTIPTTVSP